MSAHASTDFGVGALSTPLERRLNQLESMFVRSSRAERWHDELYDHAPIGFILYAPPPDNRILWANACMQDLFFGVRDADLLMSPAEAIGQPFPLVFEKDLADYVHARNAEVLASGRPQPETWSDTRRPGVIWDMRRWLTPGGNVAAVLIPPTQSLLEKCWDSGRA